MIKKLKIFLDFIQKEIRYLLLKNKEIKNIKNKRKIYETVTLTKKQEKEIIDFYRKNYGKKIDTRWHRLYQSYTGKFDKKYFPEILFSTKLEPILADRNISKQLTDKSMVELLYSGVKDLYIPKTVVLNCNGIWYDEKRNIISSKKAYEILSNCGKKVWKKIVDSSSGRSVIITNIINEYDKKNNMKLCDLIKKYGDNFIVQECITNNKQLSKLYDKSLNTFRVITYTIDGKMYHVPIALRIGSAGNEVDNIHAGGMFIGVKDDGNLMNMAFTEYKKEYLQHPDSKVKFESYKIDGIDKMINIAYKCHGRTPHIKLISWDFTINDKNEIVLIEVNLNGQSIWFPQMANGRSAFGDNTEYMLNLIKCGRK